MWRPQHHGGRRVLRPIIDAAPETHRRQPGVVPLRGDERDLRQPHVKPRPEVVSEEAPLPLDRTRHRVAEPVRPVRRRGVFFDDARAGRRGKLLGVQGLGNGVRGATHVESKTLRRTLPVTVRGSHDGWGFAPGARAVKCENHAQHGHVRGGETHRAGSSSVSQGCAATERVHAWWFEYALPILE